MVKAFIRVMALTMVIVIDFIFYERVIARTLASASKSGTI